MKIVARFLGTVAGGLFALLALGGGIVSASLLNAVIAALVIGVVWILIPPIGRIFSPWLDPLVLGIPALCLDAGLLMLITGMLDGLTIHHFGWALLAALFIMVGRLLGTGIVTNKNNPEGLSIFGDIHADENEQAESEINADEADAASSLEEDGLDGGEEEDSADTYVDPMQSMFEMEIGDDEEPKAEDSQEEEESLPMAEGI